MYTLFVALAHFFAFDVHSAPLSPWRPFEKRLSGTRQLNSLIGQIPNIAEKMEVTLGEKKGWKERKQSSDIRATNKRIANEFNVLQHNRNVCSH